MLDHVIKYFMITTLPLRIKFKDTFIFYHWFITLRFKTMLPTVYNNDNVFIKYNLIKIKNIL